ncbi:MAG TPA: CDP-6-deoxy-delta-3,4-glucoseen reductase [Burkholderiaceae bacterium]|nr:CDP-6-deoxy-delta-3,4-glucoseen reductase [Burkholderiaceae bacterium]
MAFKVTVRPSGREFTVEPGETILAAALRSGIGLPYGCKNGACGTCKGKVLEGEWHQGPHARSALHDEERKRGLALFCSSNPTSDLVIEARELSGFGDIPVRKMPCRIAKIERPVADVAIVSLQLPANDRLQYRAGQFIEFLLKDGVRRSYSMATAPHADELIQVHVRHMPGGVFTDQLFGPREPPIKERDILRFEGPLGTFFLREDNQRPIILLASGTGFAPIKAIAEHIFFKRLNRDEPEKPARPVVLYWGCRTRRDLYMPELPEQWAREQPNFTYVPVLSDATPDDAWTGRTGFVHQAVMEDFANLSGHQVYACGAPVMVEAARADFIEHRGLPEEQFFADAFTSQKDIVDD